MFAGEAAAELVNESVDFALDLRKHFFPFFLSTVIFQDIDMDVAVTAVASAVHSDVVFFGEAGNLLYSTRDFRHRYNDIFHGED